MNTSIKVKFTESISSEAGSFAHGEETRIPLELARPWAKTGQVLLLEKLPDGETVEPHVKGVVTPPPAKPVHKPKAHSPSGKKGKK